MKTTLQVTERWVCLGIDEDCETCDCCGRTGLKKTIVMGIRQTESGETDEVGRFGCVCAAKHSGLPAARIRVLARTAQNERELQSAVAEGQRVADSLLGVEPPAPAVTVEDDCMFWRADGIEVRCFGGTISRERIEERLACYREAWLSKAIHALLCPAPAWLVEMPPSSWNYEAYRAACRLMGSRRHK